MNALATDAVASARDMLHGAIRAGRDTFTARKELTAAETAAAKEKAMSDKILAQAQAARRDAIARSVEAECMELRSAILAECAAALPGFQVEVVIESHRLTALLEARARREEVETARAELDHDLENLRVRLGEVESQIAAIHASDDRSDAAMGRVHMLGLDRSDIAALIEAAQSQLETLTIPAIADAERAWRDAQLAARYRARHQVMVEMEKRLLTLATEARDAFGPGFGTEHRYKPCQLMRQSCVNSII